MEDKKIIKFDGKEFPASEYQQKVFEFLQTGCGNLVINASAGSAKTTTLVNCMRFIPENKKAMFVSFNKHIAEEINKKISQPNAIARTCSSIGYEICRENHIGLTEVNNEKYNDYLREHILELTQFGEIKSLGHDKGTYMRNIRQLVDLCRYTMNFTAKQIQELALKYRIGLVRDEISVCHEILKWGEANTDVIDQTDMVWLPNALNLTTKRLLKDFIFIDEAQDISIAQQQLLMKCAKRGARIIAVGDKNQQINVWCGSDEEAIDTFRKKENTIEIDLPVCYRCPKNIIEFANKKCNSNMVAPEWAIDGNINFNATLSDIATGDMVLSRNTAPLIELQQILLRRNKKVFIQGFKEIKEDYLELINATRAKIIDRNCLSSDGLLAQLYKSLLSEINRLITVVGMDEDEALSRASVLYQYDNIQAIKVLSEGMITVDELIDKINIIFNEDDNNAVILSTVHRAKGLEADNIFIYQPSILEYNQLATKDWEIKTEQNLRYVAYTRAKKTLNFIPEDENFKKHNPYSGNNLKREIKKIKEMVNYADTPLVMRTQPTMVKEKEVDGMHAYVKPVEKKKKGGLKFVNLMEN